MKFTGERMIPDENKGGLVWSEHYVRYIFATQFVKGLSVLDIACGSGFGTFHMASKGAKSVVGIDISPEAIRYAKRRYSLDNTSFQVGDCENIPIAENSIDIVVSFETIEHVKVYEKFLKEVKRVLKPNGILLLSTPNEKVFPKGNPFHLKEFNFKELDHLLSVYFKNKKFLFEHNWFSSTVLTKESTVKEDLLAKLKDIDLFKMTGSDPDDSLYFLVLASDNTLPKTIKQSVGLFSPSIDFNSMIADFAHKVEILEGENGDMKKTLYDREQELRNIYGSNSWKLATNMKRIKNIIIPRKNDKG